jgi:hypothetical protein
MRNDHGQNFGIYINDRCNVRVRCRSALLCRSTGGAVRAENAFFLAPRDSLDQENDHLPRQARDQHSKELCGDETRRAFFECFPYVCPEPVLVKCSFIYIYAQKRTVFPHAQGFDYPDGLLDNQVREMPFRETPFRVPFSDHNKTIILPRQARDGQECGKAEQKGAFHQGVCVPRGADGDVDMASTIDDATGTFFESSFLLFVPSRSW